MSVKRALIAIDHVQMFRARTVNAILASGALFTRAGEVRGPWCGAADLLFFSPFFFYPDVRIKNSDPYSPGSPPPKLLNARIGRLQSQQAMANME